MLTRDSDKFSEQRMHHPHSSRRSFIDVAQAKNRFKDIILSLKMAGNGFISPQTPSPPPLPILLQKTIQQFTFLPRLNLAENVVN